MKLLDDGNLFAWKLKSPEETKNASKVNNDASKSTNHKILDNIDVRGYILTTNFDAWDQNKALQNFHNFIMLK